MPYLQLRITLDPSGTRSYHPVRSLLRHFIVKWIPDSSDNIFTCGYEKLNKYGEPCSPHFHLNVSIDPMTIDLTNPLRSAREFLRREAVKRDFSLKGNKQWSLTMVEEPKDFERWIRYPLKETPVLELTGFGRLNKKAEPWTHKFISEQMPLAQAERKRSIELNLLKRDKLADKTSFRDKLFEHLDSLLIGQTQQELLDIISENKSLPSHQDIWISILEFYQSQGKAICFKTVTGYTVGYQLHIKAITPLQCYVMRSNPQ